jgi:hypothetical protein
MHTHQCTYTFDNEEIATGLARRVRPKSFPSQALPLVQDNPISLPPPPKQRQNRTTANRIKDGKLTKLSYETGADAGAIAEDFGWRISSFSAGFPQIMVPWNETTLATLFMREYPMTKGSPFDAMRHADRIPGASFRDRSQEQTSLPSEGGAADYCRAA